MATSIAKPAAATWPATGLIFTAIPKVMKAVGAVPKSREAKAGPATYAFRGIDDLYAAIQGAFIEQGVFCCPEVVDVKRERAETQRGGALIFTILTVRHTFYAADGSGVVVTTVGEAMDTSDKASNKAMSAAMKYALIELLSLPTAEPKDTENDDHRVVADGRQATIQQIRAILGGQRDAQELKRKWFDKAGVKDFEEMSTADLDRCFAYLRQRQNPPAAKPENGDDAMRPLRERF